MLVRRTALAATVLALVAAPPASGAPPGAPAPARGASAHAPPSLSALALRAASAVGVELAARSLRDRARATAFPIRGPHDLGRSPANDFGGPRGHQGQDMFAACGTPVVAAAGGRVLHVGDEAAAGHYLVIGLGDGRAEVYMHMRDRPPVREGEALAAGEPVGRIGDTGDAEGCHLHFELWTAPGWYRGGRPVDPLPLLRRLR